MLNDESDATARPDLFSALLPTPGQEPCPRRNCGLAGRGQADLKDAAKFILEEWVNVSREAIVHCWVKSSVFPASMNASMVPMHAEYRQVFSSVEAH